MCNTALSLCCISSSQIRRYYFQSGLMNLGKLQTYVCELKAGIWSSILVHSASKGNSKPAWPSILSSQLWLKCNTGAFSAIPEDTRGTRPWCLLRIAHHEGGFSPRKGLSGIIFPIGVFMRAYRATQSLRDFCHHPVNHYWGKAVFFEISDLFCSPEGFIEASTALASVWIACCQPASWLQFRAQRYAALRDGPRAPLGLLGTWSHSCFCQPSRGGPRGHGVRRKEPAWVITRSNVLHQRAGVKLWGELNTALDSMSWMHTSCSSWPPLVVLPQLWNCHGVVADSKNKYHCDCRKHISGFILTRFMLMEKKTLEGLHLHPFTLFLCSGLWNLLLKPLVIWWNSELWI